MFHKRIASLATLTLAGLALSGCGLLGDGPSDSTEATGVAARFVMAPATRTGDLQVDSLTVQVAEVVFDAEGPDGSISLTQEQHRSYDVTDGTPDEDVVPIDLEPGTYTSPYLGVEIWDDGPEPAIVLTGTLDTVPIRFVFNSGEVFEAESARLEVPEGEVRDVDFVLDPWAWFTTIDGTSLSTGDDGVAEISETSNPEAFDTAADLLDVTTDGRFPDGQGDTGDTGW